MVTIGDDLLRPASPEFGPAIEALVVYNSNPVAVAPESAKVVAGFAREDLFTVVLEHFQTDTADYADYILPATTQLEHWDVHLSYGHTDVLLNRPAIAPVGRGQAQHADFPGAGGPHGFYRPVFHRRRRKPVPYCLWIGSGFRCAAAPGLCPAAKWPTHRLPKAAFPRPPALRVFQRKACRRWARTVCPITCPTTKAGGQFSTIHWP
jgi:hypothetical protein